MRILASLVVALAACHPARGPSTPATAGVDAYLTALRGNDPTAAYALLSEDAKKQISAAQFALEWKQSEKERKWQAEALAAGAKANPSVGERAVVAFADGKMVALERDGDGWRLDSDRVGRSAAKQPRDALRSFADAVAARDVTALLASLSQRRREGLTHQLEGFMAGLAKRINDPLDQWKDRAELRWDDGGIRYRITVVREDDEWRIDDITIRPAPKEETPEPTESEGGETDF